MNFKRYTRQVSLQGFGREGQEKLYRAKVLVVGAGGLGIPALQYLNSMGVGTLGIVDNDVIDLANLQRQVIYNESDIGSLKTEVALQKLKAQNSNTNFKIYSTLLDVYNAEKIISEFDVIIDASDNFPTRYLVNDVCVILGKPFIYGALHAFEGQVSLFNYKGGPTYRCLFPEMPTPEEIPDCNVNGVLGVIPSIIGSFQALEAVKLIAGMGELLSGKLMLYDGLTQRIQLIKYPVNQENLKIKELQKTYQPGAFKSINAEEFSKLISSEKEFQILDVRNPDEFENFHIRNSLNIPLPELEKRIPELKKARPAYVICQSGIRSQKALQVLKQHVMTELTHVEGGINELKKYVATT